MSSPRGSILVVDDDDDIRQLVQMVLEGHGYSVWTAADGRAALDVLRRGEPPDVMLLDLRMPRMAGDELVGFLRTDPSLAKVPIVVVSGDSTACQRAANLNVQGCLLKPVSLEDLLSTVKKFATNGAGERTDDQYRPTGTG